MGDVDGFRDTDDGIMTRLWDWYTNPPCGDEDNDDSEEFIRSIQPEFSRSDTCVAAEVLETYVHSQRRLKTQVQELKGKLKRVSRENANLREQLQTQNTDKQEVLDDPPPISSSRSWLDFTRPSLLVQSASCSWLDSLCASQTETESIVPVKVRSLQKRPPSTLVVESFEIGADDADSDDSDEDDDDDISINDFGEFTDESTSLHRSTASRRLRKRILAQLYEAEKKAEEDRAPKSFVAKYFGGISNLPIVSSIKNAASVTLVNFTGYTLHELFKTDNGTPDEVPLHFSVGKMKKSVKRFQKSAKPVVKFVIYLNALIDWKHEQFTLVAFGVYMLSVMTGWFIQLVLLLCILKLYANYIVTYRFPINIQFIPDMRSYTVTEEAMPFSDLGITNKFQMLHHIAKRAQDTLGNYANDMEKIHNLFMWKVPGLTMFLFRILVMLFILSVMLSGIQFLKLIGLFIGFKIIILRQLYQKYPNFKYATDTVYKVWQALPTDAEYYERTSLAKLKKRKHRFDMSKKKKLISVGMNRIRKSVSQVGGKVSRASSRISRRISRTSSIFGASAEELPSFQTLKDGGKKDSDLTDVDGSKQTVQVVVADSKRPAENDDLHPSDVTIKGKISRSYFSFKGKFARLRKTPKVTSIAPGGSIAGTSTSSYDSHAPVASTSSPGKASLASASSSDKAPMASTSSPGKAVVTPKTPLAKPEITPNIPPGKVAIPFTSAPGKATVKSVISSGKPALKSTIPPAKPAATSTLPPGKEISYSRSTTGLSGSSEEFSIKKNNSHDSVPASTDNDLVVPSSSSSTPPLLRSDSSSQSYVWGSESYRRVSDIGQALGERLSSLADGTFFTRQATLIVSNQYNAQMEVPNGEPIVKEAPNGWTCVLEENASSVLTTFQPGTLYLSRSSLCFKPTDLTSSQWVIIDLTDITEIVKAEKARWIPGGNRSKHIQITVEGVKKPYIFGSVSSHNQCFKIIMIHGKVHRYPWADDYIEVPLVFLNNEEKCFSFASLYQGCTTDPYVIR